MKPRDYCCCAIPTVNAGIYVTLTEQLVLGILLGVLSFATPSIVGAATPSFAPLVFGIVCFVAGGIQILGFFGAAKDKPILFRRYVSLHSVAIAAAFSLAAAWIIISATRHSTAKAKCTRDFFDEDDSTQQDEADILCEIFPWVDVGIMGGLWVLLAIVHIYLYVVLISYSSNQQKDLAKYDALTNPNVNESIPMNYRSDWDARPSTDIYQGDRDHRRQDSAVSMSDVLSQPVREPKDGFSDYSSYPGHPAQGAAYPQAYTQDPGPTPRFNDAFYGGPSRDLNRPAYAQAHPAEGSFRRKTPRAAQADQAFNGYYS